MTALSSCLRTDEIAVIDGGGNGFRHFLLHILREISRQIVCADDGEDIDSGISRGTENLTDSPGSILFRRAIIRNCKDNLVAVGSVHRLSGHDIDVKRDMMVVRNDIPVPALKAERTDNLRDRMLQDLYNLSFCSPAASCLCDPAGLLTVFESFPVTFILMHEPRIIARKQLYFHDISVEGTQCLFLRNIQIALYAVNRHKAKTADAREEASLHVHCAGLFRMFLLFFCKGMF